MARLRQQLAMAGVLVLGGLAAVSPAHVGAVEPKVIRQGEQSVVVREAPAIKRPKGDKRLADGREARGERNIRAAWFSDPTDRYQLSAFASSEHAGSLMVATSDRRLHKLTLPPEAVFEDREPRIWDVDGDGFDEIVVVKTSLKEGASLAVVVVQGDQIRIALETAPVGPKGWLNPAGIGDFDGDGRPDIALVRTPHRLGALEIWTFRGGRLVALLREPDVSNHAKGSAHLKLAAVADFDGDGVVDLAIPAFDRRVLRVLSFKGGKLREISRTALPGLASEDFAVAAHEGRRAVKVGLLNGRVVTVVP